MTSDEPSTRHEREQLARWANLSYADRLEWLWNAKLFAARALASARARDAKAAEHAPSGTAPGESTNIG